MNIQNLIQTIKSLRKQIILAVISGLLLTLTFPKFDQGWITWFALIPFMLAVRKATAKEGFIIGAGAGIAHYLSLMYWTAHTMHVYGHLNMVTAVIILLLLTAYLALYPALFGTGLAWLCRRPWQLLTLGPVLWLALELIRSWLITGFPWLLLGYSQYKHLWMIQIADIFGVYGVSGLIVLINAGLTLAFLHWIEKKWQEIPINRRLVISAGAILIVIVLMTGIYGIIRIHFVNKSMAAASKATIAVIQGNIDQARKWDPRFQLLTTAKYKNLSLAAVPQKPDLVVWPETATPFYFLEDKLLSQMVIQGIQSVGTHFIIGSPSVDRTQSTPSYYNSAYLITAQGKVTGKYDKTHLVPFGEYVPMARWLPFINKIVAQVGDFKPGEKGKTLEWEQNRIGMQICYEIIFPSLTRAMVQNGADIFVNITNDAWFGRTSAAYQHFSMAVFRCIENRRALVRAANTGISGFIDPCGRIQVTTELFQDATLTGKTALMHQSTWYSRWGHTPLAVLVFSLTMLAFFLRFFQIKMMLNS